MPNLYELTGAALQLQQMLEAGDIEESTYKDTLEALDIDVKYENICHVIRNLEAQATAYKTEKDRLAEREKTTNNGIARLKESLLASMQVLGETKVKAGVFAVSRRTSKSVKIYDETEIPEKYLVYQPAKINKVEITKALKEGEIVSGAEFEEKESVTIR